MPSIVKLSSGDARAWRQNQPVWINAQGDVVRAVTREEQHAISRALARSSRITQSFRQTLTILPLNTNGRSVRSGAQKLARTMECAFEVGYVGQQRVVNVFHGDQQYMTGRQILAARLLADHGESILHGAGGKCIAVLRDPFIQEREPSTGRRVQWSRSVEQKAPRAPRLAKERGVSPVRQRPRRLPALPPAPKLYSPERCPNDCRGLRGNSAWYVPKGATPPPEGHHHPTCKFARDWAATLQPAGERFVLYDLEQSRIMRLATADELALAREQEQRTGSLQVTLQEQVYAILPEPEALQAAAEARGEDDPAGAIIPSAVREEEESEADTLPPEAMPLAQESELEAGAEAVELPLTRAPESNPRDRNSWPTLGQLTQGTEPYRDRAELTARDYLARPPLTSEPG